LTKTAIDSFLLSYNAENEMPTSSFWLKLSHSSLVPA
jgi:hypothetical protein